MEQNLIPIEFELKKLGLDRKEAEIYLACLELRQASVKNIASMVKLSRPTAYRMIEALEKKGLLKKIKQHKKTFILAESPDEILGILRAKKRRVEEQEREFLRIISALKNKYNYNGQNEIRAFKGEEGMRFLLDDFSTTLSKEICIVYFDGGKIKKEIAKEYKDIKKRLGKIKVKEIYPRETVSAPLDFVERKELGHAKDSFRGSMIITEKAYFIEKEKSFLIENEDIAKILRMFFEMVWK